MGYWSFVPSGTGEGVFSDGPDPQDEVGRERNRPGHLLKFKQEFDGQVFAKEEEKMKRKKVARLFNLAESLNDQLTPKP